MVAIPSTLPAASSRIVAKEKGTAHPSRMRLAGHLLPMGSV